jgi:hypothetical protein
VASLTATVLAWAGPAAAGDVIFLRDGRILSVEKWEDLGDRIRIEDAGPPREIPRAEILAIHPDPARHVPPPPRDPADVYRDIGRQMNERLQRDLQRPRPWGPIPRPR